MGESSKSRDSSPAKPARKKMETLINLRKSFGAMASFPAAFVGLCSVSSLPIYPGDMILKKEGLIAHEKYVGEFQSLLNRGKRKIVNCRKSRTDSVNQKGKLLFLHNQRWENCRCELEGNFCQFPHLIKNEMRPESHDFLIYSINQNPSRRKPF